MKNNYRLSMDYEVFNFTRFKTEYEENNGKVYWFFKANDISIEKDADIYIYCSNMPDLVNRFIISAKVSDKGTRSINKDIFERVQKFDSSIKDYNTYIELTSIKALKPSNIYDLSTKEIKKHKGFGSFQGPYGKITNKDLIEKLKNTRKESINSIFESYIDGNCFFQEHKIDLTNINKEYTHPFFIKNNGVQYVEYHHLIFRSEVNDKEKGDINQTYNQFKLCPTCHRMIHYGNSNIKKEMIDKLLNKADKEKLINLAFTLKKITKKEEQALKDYLYKIYNII